jgi:hypothetical protein
MSATSICPVSTAAVHNPPQCTTRRPPPLPKAPADREPDRTRHRRSEPRQRWRWPHGHATESLDRIDDRDNPRPPGTLLSVPLAETRNPQTQAIPGHDHVLSLSGRHDRRITCLTRSAPTRPASRTPTVSITRRFLISTIGQRQMCAKLAAPNDNNAGQHRFGPVPVNRRLSLRWFESITRHQHEKRPLTSRDAGQGPLSSCPGVSGWGRPDPGVCGTCVERSTGASRRQASLWIMNRWW